MKTLDYNVLSSHEQTQIRASRSLSSVKELMEFLEIYCGPSEYVKFNGIFYCRYSSHDDFVADSYFQIINVPDPVD